MSTREAYLYYEAGQAVAAAHLGLMVRHISGNPAQLASDIAVPKNSPKPRMIMWLTGMAAEKKGVGKSDPLRRTRNRLRMRMQIESVVAEMSGPPGKRLSLARRLMNQSQDRANAICANLFDAIDKVAQRLRDAGTVSGDEVAAIVRQVKAQRSAEGKPPVEEPPADA
jgi:hypothetical protein